MKASVKAPKPACPMSTVNILQNGSQRVSQTAAATWASYSLEIAGEMYTIVVWAHGPHADDLVPHLVAQAMVWRPHEEKAVDG